MRLLDPRQLLALCLFAGSLLPAQSIGNAVAGSPERTVLSTQLPTPTVPVTAAAVVSPSSINGVISGINLPADAALLYRSGKLAAALEKYKTMLQAAPGAPQAYSGMARIYLKQGDVEAASEAVSRGLALAGSEDLHAALGEIHFRRGEIAEAEREWATLVNSGKAVARAFLGLARVRNSVGLRAQATKMLAKARELDPIDPDIEMEWNAALPPSERIRRLESYMESPDGARADRSAGQNYLAYLKMLAGPSASCQMVQPTASAEFPMVRILSDAEHVRGSGLRMSINGRRVELMLDTAVSGILLSRRLAEKAGVTKVAETQIGGVGDRGSRPGYIGTVRSVKIGDLEFHDCPVRVLQSQSVVDEDGIIGADFFQQFLLNVDFPHQRLRLSPLPAGTADEADDGAGLHAPLNRCRPPAMRSYAEAYRFGAYLLVPVRMSDGREKLFVLDSGGSASQVTPGAVRQITELHGNSSSSVSGVNGQVKTVYSADNIELQFGQMPGQWRNLTSFNLTPVSNGVGTEISGTLGFDVLQSLNIKIDYRDALVEFTPQR